MSFFGGVYSHQASRPMTSSMHSAPPIVETLQQRGCQRPLLLARVLVARTSARVEEEEEESIGRVLVEWSKWW